MGLQTAETEIVTVRAEPGPGKIDGRGVAVGGEAFEDVKPKFREQVYAMLDRGPEARPVEEQLAEIREEYEEYFIDGQAAQRLTRFGGPVRGSMPRGSVGAAEQFRMAWGFGGRR